MPRQARLDIPGAMHHIIIRGIENRDIFRDDEDRSLFLERLGLCVREGKSAVYAWAVMRNHVHVLFRSGTEGMCSVMRKLLTWYAQYFNRRHGRSGHLFENRYKSILCDEDNYLLALVRYIHLNPVRVGIIGSIEELDCYPWSGHRTIIGKVKQPWMDIDSLLSQFGGTRRKAINEYRRFIMAGFSQGTIKELTGGGLIRSQGGWSEVVAMRRRGQKEDFDQRILGGGDFVSRILKEVKEQYRRQLRHNRAGRTISKIIEEECKRSGINRLELGGGGKRRVVSGTRAAIALRSREELGLSAARIAREVGVSTSAITKAIERIEQDSKN
ncbi:MAG TPA: transposase [Thermodesulfovibrionales bacterium]|nr:transposase [Thermodesulfovibrionales bacterium]